MTDSLTLSLPEEAIDLIVARVKAELQPVGPEPWINVRAAADHLACKPQRIYDLSSRSDETRLPHRKDGSRLLFRRSELDAYLEGTR